MDHNYPDSDPDGYVGLRYWAPPEELKLLIGAAYLFTVNRDQYHDQTRADMPQLRFMLSGGGHYRFHDGREATTPEVCMLGPTMGATEFFLEGRSYVIGIAILSLGWMALECGDADKHIDDLFDMSVNQGSHYTDMLNRMRQEQDPDAAIDQLWPFLAAQFGPVSREMIDMVTKIDAWLSDKSSPEIDELAEATGLSARQVARHTHKLYGASPKLLARKYRALRCASQIVIDRMSWRELCEEGTFYDQPHFIREIKRFLGMTPHQLLNDPTAVARLTVQRRAMTGLVSELNRIS